MNPSDEAQKVEPTNVHSAAASQKPSRRMATPPAMPRRPNQRGTLRASSAASGEAITTGDGRGGAMAEPRTTDDARAAPGWATSGEREASAAAWRASSEAPPSSTIEAKN